MLRRFTPFIASTLTLFSLAPISLTIQAADGDHPLITSYPDAKIRKEMVQAYEPFKIPVSTIDVSSKPFKYTSVDTVGNLARHFYTIDNTSSLKVYENYLEAAKKLGFTVTFSCKLVACGNDDQATELGSLTSNESSVYNYYRNPYYIVAEKQGSVGKNYLAWFIGAYESTVAVQQVVVEAQALENNLIKVDPAYLNTAAQPTATEKAGADELAKDHKLLARYPNAKLRKSLKTESETVTIPTAPNAADKTPLNLSGDLAEHFYIIEDVSTLKIYENYKHALTKAGFGFLSKCDLTECGDESAAEKIGSAISVENSVYNYYRKPYYMVAKKAAEGGDIYVALFIGGYESEVAVQQVILQSKSVETGLVKINADTLKQQIDADGKALIYGIYFDTGKSAIKTESKPALDVIAQLLSKNKDLLLYVVGHTDDTGASANNLELSRQRAAAVVNELVTTYKVATARLQAQGVGPYAPAGNNTSETGKQKNRRVELVKRLQ